MGTPEIPLVSVVVSACGNAASLRNLMDALACQSLPAERMKAMVVDNDLPGPLRPIADAVRDGDWPFRVRPCPQANVPGASQEPGQPLRVGIFPR